MIDPVAAGVRHQELIRRNLLDMPGTRIQFPDAFTLIYKGGFGTAPDEKLIGKIDAARHVFSVGTITRRKQWFAIAVKVQPQSGSVEAGAAFDSLARISTAFDLAVLRFVVPTSLSMGSTGLDSVAGALDAALLTDNSDINPGILAKLGGSLKDAVIGLGTAVGGTVGAALKPLGLPLAAGVIIALIFFFRKR